MLRDYKLDNSNTQKHRQQLSKLNPSEVVTQPRLTFKTVGRVASEIIVHSN